MASSSDDMDIGGHQDGDDNNDVDGVDDSIIDEEPSEDESNYDIGSSDENIEDPLSLLKMHDQIVRVNSKFDNVNSQVGALNTNLDQVQKSI